MADRLDQIDNRENDDGLSRPVSVEEAVAVREKGEKEEGGAGKRRKKRKEDTLYAAHLSALIIGLLLPSSFSSTLTSPH